MKCLDRPLVFVPAIMVAGLVSGSGAAASAALLTPQQVIEKIEQKAADPASSARPVSDAAKLLTDIQQYRKASAALAPDAAAASWYALLERARKIDTNDASMEFAAIDMDVSQAVGVNSVFASLPPPAAWPALRKLATQRSAGASGDRESLAIRFLTEVLTHDAPAANTTLDALDKLFANLGPEKRAMANIALNQARAHVTRSYGSADQIAQYFELQIRAGNSDYAPSLEVPDLVGLVGEAQAAGMLARALKSTSTLHVESGDATRRLARQLALENVDDMRVPQWDLVDGVDAGRLFEAIEKRFDPAAGRNQDAQGEGAEDVRDYQKRQAAAWYFLGAVIEKRQSAAERALGLIAGDSEVYIPRDAVDALRKAGHDEALYQFLGAQLERRPELHAWNLYIQEAAFTGHGAESLALIDKALARTDLPAFLAADLRVRRIDALLSADRIAEAAAGYRALLAPVPARSEMTLQARFSAAIKATQVGRLAARRDLVELGLKFAIAAEPMVADDTREGRMSTNKVALWEELRRNGRANDVQLLAIGELANSAGRSGFESLGRAVTERELRSMVELASIWSAADRPQDVVQLLEQSTRWGFEDLALLVTQQDSLDAYFGNVVARALLASGDREGALRVARATLARLPGNDDAYDLVSKLDPAALTTLDILYARDEFEERPLIWKAKLQLDAGALADAEITVRRAIAVDPSDGEQGPNDRMRAYAVLADILQKRGDTQGAETYRKVVDAIRRSERADQYHEAGLYERAFRGYREALEQFSDAYCIQSRLAVQLYQQGRRAEALEHYKRAYELMPDSFGRVESHCFGCESVFQGPEAQSIAEKVFDGAIRKTPAKPQNYYLLAYLREQQDRPAEALQPLRQAVSLDPRYLNAWKRLNDLGEHTYIEPGELDIAMLKLLELDPLGRHARYETNRVTDLAALWRAAERAHVAGEAARAPADGVYRLEASAADLQRTRDSLPEEMRAQMKIFDSFRNRSGDAGPPAAAAVLYQHEMVGYTRALFGLQPNSNY